MRKEEFLEYSKLFNLIPVYRRLTADFLTPVSAFLKLRQKGTFSILLESVESIGRLARYSIIASRPQKIIKRQDQETYIIESGHVERTEMDVFQTLKKILTGIKTPTIEGFPDFAGGMIGYIGFETVADIEPDAGFRFKQSVDFPLAVIGQFNDLVVFDHFKHQTLIISMAKIEADAELTDIYDNSVKRIKDIVSQLSTEIRFKSDFQIAGDPPGLENSEDFKLLVKKAKKHIFEGDVFQLVLSKRFSREYTGDEFSVYRALRIINPSPYMYYMEFGDGRSVIGTSPEDLVKVKGNTVQILPIAGTRRRGSDADEDKKMEEQLLSDPKEIAEHMMLVDLARNDLGRICKYGSIKVEELMRVHRFTYLMHLVSRVSGNLDTNSDSIDALKSAFPAGTVTGAPKIKAIDLISKYEDEPRSVYAGAVGYIDFNGNLDMCIAIRTLFCSGNRIIWQAGAGIVADSNPDNELKEILNKSESMVRAIKYAEVIDENIDY